MGGGLRFYFGSRAISCIAQGNTRVTAVHIYRGREFAAGRSSCASSGTVHEGMARGSGIYRGNARNNMY